MVGEATERVITRKDAVGQEDEQEEWDGENEEVVERQGFGKMTMQHGMNRTLEATGRTLRPRQQSPHAFRNEGRNRGWVHDIVKDACQQDDDKKEENAQNVS